MDNLCDPCIDKPERIKALKFCNDCEKWLCFQCIDSHKKDEALRNHQILTLAQIGSQAGGKLVRKRCVVLCETCGTQEVTDYCVQHNAVICRTCKTLLHTQCRFKSISEEGQSYDRREFELIAKRATGAENKIDKFQRERMEDHEMFVTLKDTCAKEIKTVREQIQAVILKRLNKLEQTAMQELNDMASDEQQKLERHISASSTLKQMLETDSKLIKDAMQTSESSKMFAVNVKVTNKLNEYDNGLQDLYQEAKTPLMTFTRNKKLTDMLSQLDNDMLSQLDNLGNLTITHKPRRRLFTSMVVQSSREVNIKLQDDRTFPSITGCEVLPNGQIILCDRNNSKVKLLDSSFTVKDALALQAELWDVSVINNSSAIITLPGLKQLRYMQLEQSLKSGRVIQLDKMCWGIEVAGEDMYVSLHNEPGEGEVRILDMEGSLKSRIRVNPGGSLNFEMPYYLTQSATTRKIYVSDWATDTVTCLMSDGSTVYQYKDKDLQWPQGVCVNDEENIIVCGFGSHNVHIVTASGRKHSCLLTLKDGICEPRSVAYRHTDDTLIIGCRRQDDLFVYKMTS